MKCINIEQKLNELLDGEIGLSEKATVEKHLESCDSCRNSFANMQIISGNMRQNLAVSAPSLLDEKVMNAFQNFQNEKLAEVPTEKSHTEKIGWFGIPKFAYAAALLLFGLVGITAFQIGKISASEVSIIMPQVQESKVLDNSTNADFAENKQPNVENVATTKIIEVPIIKEKIVEVPVIKEKIVTKKIYVEEKNRVENTSKENTASNKKEDDNKYLTPFKLDGFQPVAKINPQITKENEENKNYEN